MAYDLSEPIVIGISSRALFDLEYENKIFEEQGVDAYEKYQVEHENDILQKGPAFQLVKAFKTDLFPSAKESDVKQAIDNDIAAGTILTGSLPAERKTKINQIRIVFDGDAVLFSSESELSAGAAFFLGEPGGHFRDPYGRLSRAISWLCG